MSISKLAQDINRAFPETELLIDEPMSRHCSFRIGGIAPLLAKPASTNQLKELLQFFRDKGEKPLVMGNGTNLLVTDERLSVPVIKLCDGLGDIFPENEDTIYAGGGIILSKLANTAKSRGLSGIEFAHGIPGSLGGAVSMNAGAYGGEMKDVVIYTDYLDSELNQKRLSGDEHEFSYRRSAFTGTDWVILGSAVRLAEGDPQEIGARMHELSEKRRSSQPLDIPSGGSTFKRPKEGYAAAMIDEAGLKGYTIGGAAVSEKHGGFVVNRGGATCDDVIRLMRHIRDEVMKKFNTELEPEVKLINREGFTKWNL